jgi:hypothetical protein
VGRTFCCWWWDQLRKVLRTFCWDEPCAATPHLQPTRRGDADEPHQAILHDFVSEVLPDVHVLWARSRPLMTSFPHSTTYVCCQTRALAIRSRSLRTSTPADDAE